MAGKKYTDTSNNKRILCIVIRTKQKVVQHHFEVRTPLVMGYLHAKRLGIQSKNERIGEKKEKEDLLEKENNELPKSEPGVLQNQN